MLNKSPTGSAPASVTTLDARAIRLSGARTIPELLRLVTGVQVQRVAPGSYLVAMRGAGGITGAPPPLPTTPPWKSLLSPTGISSPPAPPLPGAAST